MAEREREKESVWKWGKEETDGKNDVWVAAKPHKRAKNEANSMKCAQIFMHFALSECLNGTALEITERNKWR